MYVIAAIGFLTICLSLIMLINPTLWSRGIVSFSERSYFHAAEIVSRIALGCLLLLFAENTAYPLFFWIVGGVFVFAGAFLIIAGGKRHREFAVRSATFMRLFRPAGIAGVSFGTFMIYAALSSR